MTPGPKPVPGPHSFKVHENRLRRVAKRQGYDLVKSNDRYVFVDEGEWMTLAEVEMRLSVDDD